MSVKFSMPADARQDEAGKLSSLTTTEKGSLVGAVNELNSNIANNRTIKKTTETITTDVNGWIFFPNETFVVEAVFDTWCELILVRRTDDHRHRAKKYINANDGSTIQTVSANTSYSVTYWYYNYSP